MLMQPRTLLISALACAAAWLCSCGGSDDSKLGPEPGGSGGAAGAASDASAGSGESTGMDAAAEAGEDAAAGGGGAEASAADATEEPLPSLADPAEPGPCATTAVDGKAGSTGVHCVVPTSGPHPAPYPIVLFAHGFQLDSARYYAYLERLGSFCYVACTVDYSNLSGQDQDPVTMSKALDWAIAESQGTGALSGKVDAARAGSMGHSRGGKAAVNAAAQDDRFKAVLGLDPVNSCPPLSSSCPDAIAKMPDLAIPSAFLGETLDSQASGLSQACAPAADNYQKFYAAAQSPSLEVTVAGANHMSFVADLSNCLACGFCKPATADHNAVLALSLSYAAAFFERRLRGNGAYDEFLTGAKAQERYVDTGLATLQSK
jgi:dienelactone hydrolase